MEFNNLILENVWFDVLGIPGNTAIYKAASVQKLKTGKKRIIKGNPAKLFEINLSKMLS